MKEKTLFFNQQLVTIELNTLFARLFGKEIPREKTWKGAKTIARVLRAIVRASEVGNIYTPEREAAVLKGVELSLLKGCLELHFTRMAIVKPQRLLFYSFGEGKQLWYYFRLVCGPMEPMGVLPKGFYEQNREFSEPIELSKVYRFQAPEGYEQGAEKEVIMPFGEAKYYYRGGDFAIFPPYSPFDAIWKDDMTIHQRLGDKAFQAFIQEQANGQVAEME
jgi:hypothetical protein